MRPLSLRRAKVSRADAGGRLYFASDVLLDVAAEFAWPSGDPISASQRLAAERGPLPNFRRSGRVIRFAPQGAAACE